MTGCSKYREYIPRAFLGDLGPAERQVLERHLKECAPCRAEEELYATTFGHLKNAANEEVPRHFFVYEEQARRSPWRRFREMSLPWQGALAAGAAFLCLVAVAGATRLHVRADGRVVTVAFGQWPERVTTGNTLHPPALDTAALEARILKAVDEKNRRDRLEWIETFRAEAAAANRNFTPQQRALLEAALSRVEMRMENSLTAAVTGLRASNEKSIDDMYQAISARRQTDLNVIDRRIDSLAATGELKSNQTDAILETLLQVAELNVR